MVNIKQKLRKKILFNCDVIVLRKFTAWCKFHGYMRNKVLERIVKEFMEGKNGIQNKQN